ncbi:unnamed protein product [Soboliphyme baturini]|uniref:SMC hinge domain-containing protein n=1 Tax=Soboliphyme baturini TaxID=241478 RepID=A0A183J5W6_9BILA|nr:unnamed protein product [Soboliphyme baturini]
MEVDAKEKTLKAKQKEYAVCHSAVENQRSMIQDEQRKKHELKSSVEEDTALIDSRKREFQKLQLSIAGKVEEAERDRVALELARKRVAALSVGMVVDKSGERVSLKKQLMDTRKAISGIEIENARINTKTRVRFTYADPEPNFDRSRVKGVVADLIQLKDPKFATAVETAAGGGLYNVVIDTAETGKLLLKKGQLEHRVTLIPLNKILSSVIPKRVIERGKSLVKIFYSLPLINLFPFSGKTHVSSKIC